MSIELEHRDSSSTDVYEHYRALSSAAVVSLGLGLFSALAILDWIWVAVPVFGILAGVYAVRQVRRRSDELAGLGLAKAGLALSVFFLVTGAGWLSFTYATEVPPGYMRITYGELQPDPEKPDEAIPASALSLEGKKVFIKGYIYPGRDTSGIKEFLLVRDQGSCCFGGNPKITDRIQVTLADPLRLTFRPRLHKLAGVFHIEHGRAKDGPGDVFYRLEADHLE